MADNSLATAADYAEALLTARRARCWLAAIVAAMLLAQMAVFFAARFTAAVVPDAAATQPSRSQAIGRLLLEYVVSTSAFLGMASVLVLAAVLLLIVNIMLVGRLIGLSDTIKALLWCVVLAVLVFPWQALLNSPDYQGTDFRIPGVLYTWAELTAHARAPWPGVEQKILKWTRFAAFPAASGLVLLLLYLRSGRGLQLALGERRPPADL
mgnify:CR=1 FL=1